MQLFNQNTIIPKTWSDVVSLPNSTINNPRIVGGSLIGQGYSLNTIGDGDCEIGDYTNNNGILWDNSARTLNVKGNIVITGDIVSSNYTSVAPYAGYKMEYATGDAWFNSVTVRGSIIDGTTTIGGRLCSTVASAIDATGHFIDDRFNTSTKTILSDFIFGASGALQIGTYESTVSGDIRISPNGILGRNKTGNTTFSINGTTGDATFGGTLVAASGTFGTVTAGTLTGLTIQTASSGARVILSDPSSIGDIILYDDSTGGSGTVTGDSAQIAYLRTDDNTKGFWIKMRAGKDNDGDCVLETLPKRLNPTTNCYNYIYNGRDGEGTLFTTNYNEIISNHETGKVISGFKNGSIISQLYKDSTSYPTVTSVITDAANIYGSGSYHGAWSLIVGSGNYGCSGIGYHYGSTTLASDTLLGATSIVLTDASTYYTSGTGTIDGSDEFTWSGKSSNTLTGCTGVLAHSAGVKVDQRDVINVGIGMWNNNPLSLRGDTDNLFDIGTSSVRYKTGYFYNLDIENGFGGLYSAGQALTQGDTVFMSDGTEEWCIYQPDTSTYWELYSSSNKVCQLFHTNFCQSITKAYLALERTSATGLSGTVDVSIYASDGVNPTGSALVTKTINVTDIPAASPTWQEFSFTSSLTVTPDSHYSVIVDFANVVGMDLSHAIRVYRNNSAYSGGDGGIWNGSVWTMYALGVKFAVIQKPTADKIYKTDKSLGTNAPTGYTGGPSGNGNLDKWIGCVTQTCSSGDNVRVSSFGQYCNKSGISTSTFYKFYDGGNTYGHNETYAGKILSTTEQYGNMMGIKENGTVKLLIRKPFSTALGY